MKENKEVFLPRFERYCDSLILMTVGENDVPESIYDDKNIFL